MAASDHLHQHQFTKQLYHGTGGPLIGDEIQPAETGSLGAGAYATELLDYAKERARYKAAKEGRLFGLVYNVSPKSNSPEDTSHTKISQEFPDGVYSNYAFHNGLKIGDIAHTVINESAIR